MTQTFDFKFRVFNTASSLALAVVFVFLCWMFWSLLWPFNVTDTNSPSFEIQNADKLVRKNELIVVKSNFCRYFVSENEIEIYVVTQEQVLVLPKRLISMPKGCQQLSFAAGAIPQSFSLEAVEETAYLRIIVHYRVNSLRKIKQEWITDKFTIIQ